MKGYILSLILVAIVVSVCLTISHHALKKSTRMALGLIMLAAVATPLGSLALSFGSGETTLPPPEYITAEDGYVEVAKDAFCRGIEIAVAEEFLLPEDGIMVDCYGFDFAKMRAETVYITLSGEAVKADGKRLTEYAEKNFTFDGRCELEIVGR